MILELNYGSSVLTLPGSVAELLYDAGELELRVLLAIAANPAWQKDFDPHKLSTALDASASDIEAAVAFWRGGGVFKKAKGSASHRKVKESTVPSQENPSKKASAGNAAKAVTDTESDTVKPLGIEKSGPVRVVRSDGEPHYTGKELLELTERRPALQSLLNLCQNIAGKVFSTSECCKVISLADYHRLPDEYILLLFQHCQNIDKCTVPYVYKVACNLYDQGITTTEALENYLKEQEKRHSLEGKIRRLFGMGKRILSKKEQGFIADWTDKGFSEELILYAYEQSVDIAKEPSLPYMHKILQSLDEKGVKTAEEARALSDRYKQQQSQSRTAKDGRDTAAEGRRFESFDADDFFRVALNRSYGEGGEEPQGDRKDAK